MTELTEWTTPELTVLVRNQPEEAVLQGCKDDILNSPLNGPGTTGQPNNAYCRVAAANSDFCSAITTT
jgi:hypothetical protein